MKQCEHSIFSRSAIAIGGASLDIFRHRGEVSANHQPGEKSVWDVEAENLWKIVEQNPTTEDIRCGGNALNSIRRINRFGFKTAFLSVLGEHDNLQSREIRKVLDREGIENQTLTVHGYEPSIGIIERREEPGSDRQIKGRKRLYLGKEALLSQFLNAETIKDVLLDKSLVLVASTKDPVLNQQIFDTVPNSVFLSFNPGSSEYKNPKQLIAIMDKRQPDLLALNDEEIKDLWEKDEDARILAEQATKNQRLAKYVLCTLGKKGAIIAYDGDSEFIASHQVPIEKVIDTSGAGDAAHGAAAAALSSGCEPVSAVRKAIKSSADVIQHTGASGDIDKTYQDRAV